MKKLTQEEVKNHPEMLGFKLDLMRWLKVAQTAGNTEMGRRLKRAIAICNNPPVQA